MNSSPFGGILYSSGGIARVISFGITGVSTNIYIYIYIYIQSNTHKKMQKSNIHFYYSLGFSMTEVSQWQDDGVNLRLTLFWIFLSHRSSDKMSQSTFFRRKKRDKHYDYH